MRVLSVLTKTCVSKALVVLAATAMLAGVPRPAAAEDWPTRPITLVLHFAPGGLIDFIGRPIAQHLSEVFGQNVVVENKVGGGGVVGP